MLFRILGPIEVLAGGGAAPIRIPPGRQQAILGALLLEANQVVGVDQLIDLVWDGSPPATARAQIQICVSSLRQVLSDGDGSPIVTKAPGYLLRVEDGQLDLGLFGRAVADAEAATRDGRFGDGAALLRRALDHWRGDALGGGFANRQLCAAAARLDERRMTVLEDCIGLELRLGRHHELIAELTGLVDEHPLRERLRGQLMLALYRSGRGPDALAVYRGGRRQLVDQLGLEPGPALRELESAILAGRNPTAPELAGAADGAEAPIAARPPVRPRQLPADTADFTGRDALVERIVAAVGDEDRGAHGGAVPVIAITGRPGAGKSALAVHVAHRMSEDFPDGQLYVDLRGDPGADVSAGLGRLLRSLGVARTGIPDDTAERAELYRSILADRRVLVLVENAVVESQVLPLLPGGAHCAVLVTSTPRLTGLPGARVVDVDVLGVEDAVTLLASIVGQDRVAAEISTARDLVRAIGCLPLAVRVVAARLGARPHWTLWWMRSRLVDGDRPLDELTHGGVAVRTGLLAAYETLDEPARRLLDLLCIAEGDTLPAWTAGALCDDDPARCLPSLERLVDARLLDIEDTAVGGAPRYRMHCLVRAFAREQLDRHVSAADRAAALERLAGGWLALADEAHRRVYGGDFTLLHGTARRWCPDRTLLDELLADPLGWLTAERANLCAVVTQVADADLPEACWDLAVTAVTVFEARSEFDDWQRTHDVALAATQQAGDIRGTAAVLCSLGSLYLSRRRLHEARLVLEPALAHFESLDDTHGIALVCRNLGVLGYVNDMPTEAEGHYRRALRGFREVGDRVGEAYVLGRIAQLAMGRHEYDTATRQLEAALAMSRTAGNARLNAQLRYRMGRVLLLRSRYDQAEHVLAEVLEAIRSTGDTLGESFALHSLGVVWQRTGRPDAAVAAIEQALALREQVRDRFGSGRIRLDLAQLLAELDDIPAAVGMAREALAVFRDHEVPTWERKARDVLEGIVVGDPLATPH